MSTLQEALNFEAKEAAVSLEELMGQILKNAEEAGENIRQEELDDYTIRKMTLAKHYLLKDIEKMEKMKKAIVAEWDTRIDKKKNEIKAIEDIIFKFLKNQNGGKALQFDIATISTKKNPHRVKVTDEAKAREYLAANNLLEDFLKPAPLDNSSLQKYMLDKLMEKANKHAQEKIKQEIENSPKKKISKQREKEILNETIKDLIEDFKQSLPEGFEYIEPSESIQFRYNI